MEEKPAPSEILSSIECIEREAAEISSMVDSSLKTFNEHFETNIGRLGDLQTTWEQNVDDTCDAINHHLDAAAVTFDLTSDLAAKLTEAGVWQDRVRRLKVITSKLDAACTRAIAKKNQGAVINV